MPNYSKRNLSFVLIILLLVMSSLACRNSARKGDTTGTPTTTATIIPHFPLPVKPLAQLSLQSQLAPTLP